MTKAVENKPKHHHHHAAPTTDKPSVPLPPERPGDAGAAAPAQGAPTGKPASDNRALQHGKGKLSSFGLPEAPAGKPAPGASTESAGKPADGATPASGNAARPDIGSYADKFGHQTYVKNGQDGKLLDNLKAAAGAHPELASGQLGKDLAAGKITPAGMKELQQHLHEKGYDLGKPGKDGKYGPQTHAALASFLAADGKSNAASQTNAAAAPAHAGDTPPAAPAPANPAGGPIQGQGLHKDGLTIPTGGQGKGTVFWNGHIPYKGAVDKENMQNGGKGAWGDKNAPTDYAIALPVSNNKWHNQKVLITNPQTGKQVVALVQDKGPNPRTGAKIDMTPVVMEGLGVNFRQGSAHVRFEFAPADAPVGPVH